MPPIFIGFVTLCMPAPLEPTLGYRSPSSSSSVSDPSQGPSAQHPYLSDDSHSLKPSSDAPLPTTGAGAEPLLCGAEATDLSLATGGDWAPETDSPLLFLQRGFRELIKCRQVLKGSFPMAFYMMTEEDSSSYSRWRQ
jgi:hypothetical protein